MRYQPQGLQRIDWANPITRGLRVAWNAAAPLGNPAGAKPSVVTSTKTITSGGIGGAVTGVTSAVQIPVPSLPNSVSALVMYITPTVSGPNQSLGFLTDSGITSNWNCGIHPYATGRWQFSTRSNVGYNYTDANISSLQPNTIMVLSGSYTYGGTMRTYSNGNATGTGAISGTSGFFTSSNPVWVIGYGDGDSSNDTVLLSMFWDRELTQQEHLSLAANPWQIFQAPDEDDFVAAVGGNTGSSATVDGADVSSAAGAVAISASAAAVDGVDTGIAIGGVAVSGSSATTDGPDISQSTSVRKTAYYDGGGGDDADYREFYAKMVRKHAQPDLVEVLAKVEAEPETETPVAQPIAPIAKQPAPPRGAGLDMQPAVAAPVPTPAIALLVASVRHPAQTAMPLVSPPKSPEPAIAAAPPAKAPIVNDYEAAMQLIMDLLPELF
jgi:hypothetical protein